MSNKNKYIPLPGGKECRPVNPYDQDGMEHLFNMFEAENHPSIPITEVMPDGEFEGVEDWRYWHPVQERYFSEREDQKQYFKDFNEYSERSMREGNIKTQLAIKPLKANQLVKFPADSSDRDWPEDFEHENGNYTCICSAGCKQHFTGHKRRVLCKACATQKPKVDVVENKETVEEAAEKGWYNRFQSGQTDPTYDNGFVDGANWQQSQCIEGIVGFVLEWVKENYRYIDGDLYIFFEESKDAIIKDLKNGK